MIAEQAAPPDQSPDVPRGLIYEVLNGRPLYYRGYKDVLAGIVSIEAIMGSSDVQGAIISLLNAIIWNGVDRTKYRTVSNETGIQLGKGNHVAVDIALFDKRQIPAVFKEKYFDVAPKVVVEVDIKIDLAIIHQWDYVAQKTRELFQFGVERVIWIMTQSRQVLVAVPDQDWLITDFAKNVLIIDDFSLNVDQLLDEDGIAY